MNVIQDLLCSPHLEEMGKNLTNKTTLVFKGKKWISTVHKHYVVLKCLVRYKCNYPFCKEFFTFPSSVTKNVKIPHRRLKGTAGKLLLFVLSKNRKLKLSR